jgi:hypothetical protein
MSWDWETRPGIDWVALLSDIRFPFELYFWSSVMFFTSFTGFVGNALSLLSF